MLFLERHGGGRRREKHASPQFMLNTQAFMEDSSVSLCSWLIATWLVVNAESGTSSCGLAEHLGITQKFAWFALHGIGFGLRCRTAASWVGAAATDIRIFAGA